MRLQQGKQERYDFCMKSYEISDKTVNSMLSAARYAAGHMKKQLTAMPSASTKDYARLHKAYTLEVQDIRALKALVWVGNTYNWDTVVADVRRILANLPLTPLNLQIVVDELLIKYGEDSPKESSNAEASQGEAAPAKSLSQEEHNIQVVQQSVAAFNAEKTLRFEDLQTQLSALQEETTLDEMAVAHSEYETKVTNLLASVRQKKGNIIAQYEKRMQETMKPPAGSYMAVASQEAQARSQIQALQKECESELAQVQAYEARVMQELQEVKAVAVGPTGVDVGAKADQVKSLVAALESQELFTKAHLAEIQGSLDAIQNARSQERASEAQARSLVLSYTEMLEQEKKTAEEAKGAYVYEAQRVEKAETEAAALGQRVNELEEVIKTLQLELTSERSARAMAELKAAAGRV